MKRSSSLQFFTEHKWLEHSEACVCRAAVCLSVHARGLLVLHMLQEPPSWE